ncbi:MAG: hypothetical protein NXI32_09685 [bacterium]|nr:hypothetical protein [bacterium]
MRSLSGLVLTMLLAINCLQADELTQERFDQLLQEVQPAKDAMWRTIPWNISLLDAQRQAVEQRKPIFIWAMDGNPLGCT